MKEKLTWVILLKTIEAYANLMCNADSAQKVDERFWAQLMAMPLSVPKRRKNEVVRRLQEILDSFKEYLGEEDYEYISKILQSY